MMFFRKKPPKSGGFFTSIDDLPMWNWREVRKTEDLSHLGTGTPEQLEKAWEKINDEWFEAFGVTPEYIRWFNAVKSLTLLRYEMVATDNITLLAIIKRKEREVALLEKVEDYDFDEQHAKLVLMAKMQIDLKTTTVKEYYYLMQAANESTKRHNQAAGKNKED